MKNLKNDEECKLIKAYIEFSCDRYDQGLYILVFFLLILPRDKITKTTEQEI